MNSSFFANLDPDVYKTIVFIFLLILIMRFIILILEKLLDHKLKNKIIERGLPEAFSVALLQTEKINEKTNNIKWFLILFSTGIGLLITAKFLPLGIHSIAIITISISLGFLAHSFYLKTYDK